MQRTSLSEKQNSKLRVVPKQEREIIFMGLSGIFKEKSYQQEISDLRQQLDEANKTIEELNRTIDIVGKNILTDIVSCQDKLSDLQHQKETEENNICDLKKQSSILEEEIKHKKSLIISLDDEITVESFGLYKPQFNFACALDYKEALIQIRSIQKDLIKLGNAVTGNQNLTVDGSIPKGQIVLKNLQKLFLRAFNNECDELVSKVKYTNFDASLKKLHSAAESISKLGSKTVGISITPSYVNAKVKELRLAFEYQQKKQEEKEAIREAKIQEREAAKLQKEIAEQRKAIHKEQLHYERALSELNKLLLIHPEDTDLAFKKQSIEKELADIEKSLTDIDYREANQRAGYVYIISNIGSFGENIYKIGMTRRLDPLERIAELGDASVPFNFDVHAMIFSEDAPALEAALHRAFENRKLNMVNTRREFFNVSLEEIKTVVKQNFDKTVEFIDVPDAEQYRISQKLQSNKK